VCVVETCPPAPPLPDASVLPDAPALPDASAVPDVFTADVWMPAVDAATDSSGVGPSYDCGPEGAGLRCNCGPGSYFPAPVNDAGQPQPVVTPDPAAVVAYHTMTEFDVLAVGRWQRTAGMGELICDQFGVEFTADHRLIPLALASDGSVQPVTAQARSFTITFDSAGAPRWLQVAGLQTNPPVFFEGGRSMYFLFSPWPANYVRVP
jgi:hypothetical protein